MDINGLNALFNSGNWSLIQPAMEQFNTAGEKAKADVAESQARTNRSNTLLPADLAHTKALTRQSNVTSDATQDTLDVKRGVPMADRTQEYWNELRGKSSDAQLKVISNNMEAMRYYASKPTLTLEDQTTMRQQYPGLFEQLSKPGGRQVAMQAYDDFVKHSADYQKTELQGQYHLKGAQATAGAVLQSMREQIAAGKYDKPWMVSETSRIDLEHDPAKKQAMLIDLASKVGPETPEGQQLLYRAQALDNAVKLQRGAVAKPGSTDKGTMGIPVNPGGSGMPSNSKPGSSPDNPIILK